MNDAAAMLWNAWAHVRDAKDALYKKNATLNPRTHGKEISALAEDCEALSATMHIFYLTATLLTAEQDWAKKLAELRDPNMTAYGSLRR